MEHLTACKICNTKVLVPIKRYMVTESLDESWKSAIDRLQLPREFPIQLVACARCGFLFYQDMLSAAEMTRLYTEEARYTRPKSHQLKPGRLWELRGMESFLELHLPRSEIKTVLDVGAGDFVALERVIALHPNAQYSAVDPSYPDASRNGITIFRTMVEDWKHTATYDLVSAIHVLEHVGNLNPFLKTLHSLVKPTKYLYIEIPFQVGPGLFSRRSANVQHVNYFTPRSLGSLLRRNGFEPLHVTFDTSGYQYNGMPGMIRVLSRSSTGRLRPAYGGILPSLAYLANPFFFLRSRLTRTAK